MANLHKPLTPPDCDLRDFPRMMVDVGRLMGSQFNAIASRNPTAWMLGHKLWYRAWHQVPAASLPDDDDQLCHLAELGFDMKTWRKARAIALHGWVRCDDGRIYHPVVAEAALEAWIEKLLQRLSSGAGNAKRYGHAFDPASLNAAIDAAALLLFELNPRSKAADKLKRRQSRTPSDGLPPGEENPPTGSELPPPLASQGTGTGISREEGSNDPPSLSPPARAKGRASPIPDGFPSESDIEAARGWIAKAGVRLDPAEHARRFRNYNLSHGRELADWVAGWFGWIEIEIGKAPALPPADAPAQPTAWEGPHEVWELAVARKSLDWARSYIGGCAWTGGGLSTTSSTVAKAIKAAIGDDLNAAGWTVEHVSPADQVAA